MPVFFDIATDQEIEKLLNDLQQQIFFLLDQHQPEWDANLIKLGFQVEEILFDKRLAFVSPGQGSLVLLRTNINLGLE
ncbi:MAG: hypothetical protein GF390_02440, partial [Candidatus Pacebacteria bacterium]|nr:hypothetical protein [Candidatus Paceibacterota bacterium]